MQRRSIVIILGNYQTCKLLECITVRPRPLYSHQKQFVHFILRLLSNANVNPSVDKIPRSKLSLVVIVQFEANLARPLNVASSSSFILISILGVVGKRLLPNFFIHHRPLLLRTLHRTVPSKERQD